MADIIDLESRRRSLRQHYDDQVRKSTQQSSQADIELENLAAMVHMIKDESFVPGFPSIDDVLNWLTVHKHGGHRTGGTGYSAEEMKQLEMIAHHGQRLVDRLIKAKHSVHQFLDKWKGNDQQAVDVAAFLDHELTNDIETINEVIRLFQPQR